MYAHTHTRTMEHSSVIEKDEILPFGTMWMKLEGTMLSDRSHVHNRPHIVRVHWSEMSRRGKSIETESRLVVAKN